MSQYAFSAGLISEAAKHHLELKYKAMQPLDRNHIDNQGSNSEAHTMSAGPPPPQESTPDAGLQERRLPDREVTDETIDDAFVEFIMYCNPAVASDTDTAELRKLFRAPPKSDGNLFNIFTLFELIRKLELKEIKTWAQLAIILGVEPPALDKGQSSQKVQQYAVRLKRWMHAMHVDAFFEYLLNKGHVYWTQIPSADEPPSSFGRDGVTAEEDLALRALLPETRPKRGRRKAEDRDDGSEEGKSPSQRRRLNSPTLSEDFMMARASIPENASQKFQQVFQSRVVPWSATETRAPALPESFRWVPDDVQTPMSAYPQSAITPSTNGRNIWNDGSRSAITPNKPRSRRRHGPAVSSAWPSYGSTLPGKLRGRPPSNRSVTDGPFSTFPANPGNRDIPTINLRDITPTLTPVVSNTATPQFFPPLRPEAPKPPGTQEPSGRPSRLSLQVPERQGGSVRLATPPPPAGLLNPERNASIPNDPMNQPQHFTPMMEYFNTPSTGDPDSGLGHFVNITFRQNEVADRTNIDALESHFISEILGADWYDSAGVRIERCSIDEADKICKQVIQNLQSESSCTEAFLINLSALAGGPLMTRLRMSRLELGLRTDYECHWKLKFGSIEGEFTIKATVQRDAAPKAVESELGDTETSWKQRYLDLKQKIREQDEVVGKLKRSVLESLVSSNHFGSAV